MSELLKKYTLLIIVTLLLSKTAYCQLLTASYGPKLEIKKKSLFNQNLIEVNGNFYAIELKVKQNIAGKISGQYIIHKFDKDLNLKLTKPLNIVFNSEIGDVGDDDDQIIYSAANDSEIIIVASKIKNKKGKKYLLQYKYNIDSLNQIGNEKTIIESRYKNSFLQQYFKYNFTYSPDSTMIMFYEVNEIKIKEKEINYSIVDKKGNILESGNHKIQNKEKKIPYILSAAIDNSGIIYFIKTEKSKKKGKTYDIIKVDSQSKGVAYTELSFSSVNQNRISSILVKTSNKSLVYILGHTISKNGKFTENVFFSSFKNPKDILEFKKINISEHLNFESQYNNKIEKKNKFKLNNFILKSNGNLLCIGENIVKKEKGNINSRTYYYEYGDVLIYEIDLNSKNLKYLSKIKKSSDSNILFDKDFFLQLTENKAIIINLDNPDNDLNKRKTKEPKNHKNKESLLINTILENGQIDKKQYTKPDRDSNFSFNLNNVLLTNDKELIFVETHIKVSKSIHRLARIRL